MSLGSTESGKSGAFEMSPMLANHVRSVAATPTAAAMGTNERGRHSKTRISTPKSTAASGVPNTAAIPPDAPATSSVRRSRAVRSRNCAKTEPTAPPVRMIGPSAPKGPPEPMLIALESGFRKTSRGSTLLPLIRIVSIASGMPWPRIRSEPKRAMRPTMSPPTTGITTVQAPNRCSVGGTRRQPRSP